MVACAVEAFGAGLKLFQAQGGQVVAGANVGKGQGAGVFKHLQGQYFGALHPVGGLFAVQGEDGLFEVKALHGHFGGLQAAGTVPLVDGVDAFFDVAALKADVDNRLHGLGLASLRCVVGNDQAVAVCAVLEPVHPAFFFQAAVDVVVVGFVVLNPKGLCWPRG